jgi:formylglycine-generating enzyme required for sulfatase activity
VNVLPRIAVVAALIGGLMLISGGEAVAGADTKTLQAGQTFRDCSDCPEMVVIPAGSFVMGSPAEETARELASMQSDESEFNKRSLEWEHPQHSVSIARPFAMGKYPVTRGEFAVFVHETGYRSTNNCILYAPHIIRARGNWQNPAFNQSDRDPVVCASWQDAKAYIDWLNGKIRGPAPTAGDGPYRLPSEAEYEYAARGGTQTEYWWGDVIGSGNTVCEGCGSSWDMKQPVPVGSFRPNPFGLHDVLGNG